MHIGNVKLLIATNDAWVHYIEKAIHARRTQLLTWSYNNAENNVAPLQKIVFYTFCKDVKYTKYKLISIYILYNSGS